MIIDYTGLLASPLRAVAAKIATCRCCEATGRVVKATGRIAEASENIMHVSGFF